MFKPSAPNLLNCSSTEETYRYFKSMCAMVFFGLSGQPSVQENNHLSMCCTQLPALLGCYIKKEEIHTIY